MEQLIVKSLLPLGIAILFLVIRFISRRREERRLVRILHRFTIQHLNRLIGVYFFLQESVSVPTGTAREMAALAGSAHCKYQSGQCQPNPKILHLCT